MAKTNEPNEEKYEFPSFGCWTIDEKTGKKVPGLSPRNAHLVKENDKPKPAKVKE